MKYIFILLIALQILSPKINGHAQEDRSLYNQGIRAVNEKNFNLAFMYFQQFLRAYPDSKLAESVLFAIGEYYFSIKAYYDSFHTFSRLVKGFPESKARLFAMVYLLETAKRENKQDAVNELKKQIVTYQKVKLLFSDFKEYTYTAPASRKYKAIYYIDRVEIFIDEEFFTEILH